MIDLLATLRAAGLTVVDSRVTPPRPGSFDPVGVLNHHTADGPGDAPSLRIVQHGRSDLPGPLCNLLLGRSGKFHLVCTGRANHAGAGSGNVLARVRKDEAPKGDAAKLGLVDDASGNAYFYGIEVENNGRGELYPEVQIEALVRANAAICKAHGWSANRCIHHREWTRRKIDMSWRGDLRGRVAALLDGGIYQGEEDLTPEQAKQLDTVAIEVHNTQEAIGQRLNGTIKDVLDRIDALEVGGGTVDVDKLAEAVATKIAARLKD